MNSESATMIRVAAAARRRTARRTGERRHDPQTMIPTTTSDSASRMPGRRAPRSSCASRRDDLHVRDVPPEHLLEAAALLAGQQRRRVDPGKQRPVRLERLRQRTRPPAPARARRRARDLNTGFGTRCRRMSSDCTSGMPALSSVASSWLKTRNSRVSPGGAAAARARPRPAPAAAIARTTAPSPRARGAAAPRCRRRTPR
jgi:hypothetical protein